MKIESYYLCRNYIDYLTQDCSNSIANALDYCSLALSHQYVCARGKWNAFCLSFPDCWNTCKSDLTSALQWRHNKHDGVSNHQPHECLLNRLFRRRSKETPKLRVTGLCVGNSPGTGKFTAQKASNAENVYIWWYHQGVWRCDPIGYCRVIKEFFH